MQYNNKRNETMKGLAAKQYALNRPKNSIPFEKRKENNLNNNNNRIKKKKKRASVRASARAKQFSI